MSEREREKEWVSEREREREKEWVSERVSERDSLEMYYKLYESKNVIKWYFNQ